MYKTWPGLGEAVCTHPQAFLREFFFLILVSRKLKIFMLKLFYLYRNLHQEFTIRDSKMFSSTFIYSLSQITSSYTSIFFIQIASQLFNIAIKRTKTGKISILINYYML